MQKHVNLGDLVKSFPTNIFLQNLASIHKRTSPIKFAHLAEKSGKGSISTKVPGGGAVAFPNYSAERAGRPWEMPVYEAEPGRFVSLHDYPGLAELVAL